LREMRIEVLGTGCAKCKRLLKNVEMAISQTGIQATIAKVEDLSEIMERGVVITPGLIIDGEVKAMGRVPSAEEIAQMLRDDPS
jgi:small redox-active disulfide protein 2